LLYGHEEQHEHDTKSQSVEKNCRKVGLSSRRASMELQISSKLPEKALPLVENKTGK
jgi:hypothetical protein